MAEYMDLSEGGSIKFTVGIILAWMIFCAVLLVGAGIRELKDSRASEKVQIEQTKSREQQSASRNLHFQKKCCIFAVANNLIINLI